MTVKKVGIRRVVTGLANVSQDVSSISTTTAFNAVVVTTAIVYNVLDYGAVGNGTTDDTTAVQAAITAAEAIGAGTIVYFPDDSGQPKTYLCGQLNFIGGNIELRGAFTSGSPRPTTWTSIIKHKPNLSANLIRAYSGNYGHNTTIRYLELDGNGANRTDGYTLCYLSNSHGIKLIDCYLHDNKCTGTVYGEAIQAENGHSFEVRDCTFYHNSGDVFYPGTTYNSIMDNCLSTDAVMESFSVYGAAHDNTCSNNTFIGCMECAVNVQDMGGSPYNTIVDANTITNCHGGVYFYGSSYNNTATNNVITGGANALYYGLHTGNTSYGNTLSGNTITGWSLTDSYAIWVNSSGASNTFTGNTATGSNWCVISNVCTFSGNTITGGTDRGLFITGTFTGLTVADNVITGCSHSGVDVASYPVNLVFTGNTCNDNGAFGGVFLQHALTGLSFVGNTCIDTRSGGARTQGYGVYVQTGSTGTYTGNTTTNNLAAQNWDGLTAV